MNRRRAKIFGAILVATALVNSAPALPPQTVAQAPAPDSGDADFKALVTKTNLYVKTLNALSSVQRSYDRYVSWIDLKKGFTGKERYITYGLYEISRSTVDDLRAAAEKGPQSRPPLPELDAAVVRIADAVTALAPLVKRADDYFEQEDYKDDGARLGKELHAQMMPLFERTFAAEAELRRGLDTIKAQLDQQQLAEVEKVSGRKYEWHLRSYMIAAKLLVALLPAGPEAAPISADAFKPRFSELETAYNAFQTFNTEHPEEAKKVIMSSLVDSAAKDFYTAAKFLRRTLETSKLDHSVYIDRVSEVAKTYNSLIERTNSIR